MLFSSKFISLISFYYSMNFGLLISCLQDASSTGSADQEMNAAMENAKVTFKISI